MGNCLRHAHESSQVHWGGEDWTPALMTEKERRSEAVSKPVEHVSKSASASASSMEVKIKITKKQLEQYLLHDRQLLHGEEGLPVHQALAQLIRLSAQCEAAQQRPGWRPRLQSIPEV